MLDIFEAMTTEERRVLYTVAVACVAVGVGVGLWFYSEWAQLKRLATHLLFLTLLALGIWYFAVQDPGGARLPGLVAGAPATPPPAATPSTSPPPPPPAAPRPAPPAPSGAWWE